MIVQALSGYQVKSMDPFSPVSKKTSATFTTPDGKDMMACKGAPQVTCILLHQLICLAVLPVVTCPSHCLEVVQIKSQVCLETSVPCIFGFGFVSTAENRQAQLKASVSGLLSAMLHQILNTGHGRLASSIAAHVASLHACRWSEICFQTVKPRRPATTTYPSVPPRA